jgi:hypothetical protein
MGFLPSIRHQLASAERTGDARKVQQVAERLVVRGVAMKDGTLVRWTYAEFIQLAESAGVAADRCEELLAEADWLTIH